MNGKDIKTHARCSHSLAKKVSFSLTLLCPLLIRFSQALPLLINFIKGAQKSTLLKCFIQFNTGFIRFLEVFWTPVFNSPLKLLLDVFHTQCNNGRVRFTYSVQSFQTHQELITSLGTYSFRRSLCLVPSI